ncbi:MAG: SRPBCC family protein [Marinobacter sp.]|nr:SRPBCC family protein [Marinobacter sp.]
MATYTINIQKTLDVPRSKVFALFADHNRIGKVLGAPVKRIHDSDQADPNGVGSIRKVGLGPLGLEETVTRFEPDNIIEYTITSVSPLRNHLGRILFNEKNGKTEVNYTITFEDVVPFTGKVVSVVLEQAIKKGMNRIPRLV